MVDTNLKGALYIAKESFRYLCRSAGMLIFFASSSYTRGRAQYAAYSATKAAIVNLTQALAEEWRDEGVRVNCINPARTDTPMRRENFGEESPDTLLSPEEVALRTLVLLPHSLTGQVIDIKKGV